MTDEEIRARYQREGGQLGENGAAVTRFINMLRMHEKSGNDNVKMIISKLGNLQNIEPNFTIFQSDNRDFFMHQFKALQISTKSDDLVISHEFGHAILGMINKLQIPPDFEDVVKRARAHSVSPENKEKLKRYIEYLSDSSQIERTKAEKGPISDIISSIHQYPSFNISGKTCVLPSFHNRDYYFDEEKGRMKIDKIFDEGFANFYALVANNCYSELEILKMLFGEEWLQVMNAELEKAAIAICHVPEIQPTQPLEQIKSAVIGVKKEDIPTELIPREIIQTNERADS